MLRLAGQLNGCARNGHQIAGLNGQARRRLRALHLNGCPGANLTVLIAGRAAIDTCNGNGSGVETGQKGGNQQACLLTRMLLLGHANHQLRILVLQQQVTARGARGQRFAIELPANAGQRIAIGIAFQHKGFAQFDCLVLWGH